jgi:acetyl esterase/lipase
VASPQLDVVIQMLRANPVIQGDTIAAQRANMAAALGAVPRPPDVTYRQVDAGGVPSEWVIAPESRPDRALIHLHGGAYTMGGPDSHRLLATRLARTARARVLLPDYRLAPEHPHPAAVEDAAAAYRFVLGQGYAPSQVAISGDSAGGGLTAAVLVALRDASDAPPAAGVLISGWLDLTLRGESIRSRAGVDPMVTVALLKQSGEAYAKGSDPRAPTVSPVFADLAGLPPLLVQVGDREILLDDSRAFAERAKQAGVDVTLEVWDEMIHVWHAFADLLPEGAQACERIAEFLERRWS